MTSKPTYTVTQHESRDELAGLRATVEALRADMLQVEAQRDDLMYRHHDLSCDVASALGWDIGDKTFAEAIRELRAIVERLPLTADGVPVVPFVRIFYVSPVDGRICEGDVDSFSNRTIGQTYSTRAAAEAAKERT